MSAGALGATCTHTRRSPLWGGLLSRCDACGLVRTARKPEFEYDQRYFVEGGTGYDFDAPLARAFDRERFEVELEALEAEGLRGSVLDVGCAVGTFLLHAQQRGWQVAGVELAGFARREASRRLGVEVMGSLDALPPGARYDVVTLHHVLEHIEDPVPFLAQEVAPRVGRRLLVEVPNFASLAAQAEGPSWKDLRPEQHVHHFEPASLRATVEAAGFVVLRLRTLTDPLWSLHAALRTLRMLRALGGPVPHRADTLPPPAPELPAAWSPPTGARRVLVEASRFAFLPLVRWIERTGRAERLVVEARRADAG